MRLRHLTWGYSNLRWGEAKNSFLAISQNIYKSELCCSHSKCVVKYGSHWYRLLFTQDIFLKCKTKNCFIQNCKPSHEVMSPQLMGINIWLKLYFRKYWTVLYFTKKNTSYEVSVTSGEVKFIFRTFKNTSSEVICNRCPRTYSPINSPLSV